MIIKEAHVKSVYGIHARPSRAIALAAREFPKTKITITNMDTKEKADAASILELMGIALEYNATAIIKAEGIDEEEAAAKIVEIIQTFEVDVK